MRADQWIMLGVAGLGVYALYRVSRTSGAAPQTTETKPPTPTNLPERAGAIGTPPTGTLLVTGDVRAPRPTIALAGGHAYRARGEGLSAADVPFLSSVHVTTYDEARAAGFPDWALAGAGKATRFLYGVYGPPSAPRPNATLPRPERVEAMWLTRYDPSANVVDVASTMGSMGGRVLVGAWRSAPGWGRW